MPGNIFTAATVAMLRDAPRGLEVLLLQKSRTVSFSGLWVFPGGRVEDADVARNGHGAEDVLLTAARAAVREATEETCLTLEPSELVFFSHWLPPAAEVQKRGKGFSTFFFAADAGAQAADAVEVDGGEIATHEWLLPCEALERHAAGNLQMLPPTWMTLEGLSRVSTVREALGPSGLTAPEPRSYQTRTGTLPNGRQCFMWDGDAGWSSGDPTAEGPRLRLVLSESGAYELERSGGSGAPASAL